MTRRAFRPLSRTSAGSPRRDQPARRGGKSSRSVSSCASTTLRGGRAAICRRIRRFFLALRVGGQDRAGSLPDIAQASQRPADGPAGDPLAGVVFQDRLDQGHRPAHVREAEVLWGGVEQGLQPVILLLVQHAGSPLAVGIIQGGRVVVIAVGFDPVVNTLASHAEHQGDVGNRASAVELQDGQRSAVEADITGLGQLALQTLPLPRR